MTHEKVWESLLLYDTRNIKSVNVALPASRPEGYAEFRRKYDEAKEFPVSEYPEYIYFGLRDIPKKKRDNLPDIFLGELGLIIVSAAMHDLLQKFNLGRTRFKEVSFYEYDQKTPRPGRWYFMHILEDRRTLVPEFSDGLEQVGPDPSKNIWKAVSVPGNKFAVNPIPASDLDLWLDRSIRRRVFFSDRLKVAIKESGLSARWLRFRPCRVVARGE